MAQRLRNMIRQVELLFLVVLVALNLRIVFHHSNKNDNCKEIFLQDNLKFLQDILL